LAHAGRSSIVVAPRVNKDPVRRTGFDIRYSLYRLVREEVLMSKTVSGIRRSCANMAHHLSDEIFEEITVSRLPSITS